MNKGVSYIFLCPLSCVNGELGTLLCVCGGGLSLLSNGFPFVQSFFENVKISKLFFEMSKFKEITSREKYKKR
jgi:hypothetical protein